MVFREILRISVWEERMDVLLLIPLLASAGILTLYLAFGMFRSSAAARLGRAAAVMNLMAGLAIGIGAFSAIHAEWRLALLFLLTSAGTLIALRSQTVGSANALIRAGLLALVVGRQGAWIFLLAAAGVLALSWLMSDWLLSLSLATAGGLLLEMALVSLGILGGPAHQSDVEDA
jgi:hypothetical protein